jgi:hypothetical protein
MPYPPGMKESDIPGIDAGDELTYDEKRHIIMADVEKKIRELENELGLYVMELEYDGSVHHLKTEAQ